MQAWRSQFPIDPIPTLLSSGDPAIQFFTYRDLLGEETAPADALWRLPEAQKVLRKQAEDGSWAYPGGKSKLRSPEDYDQIETYRNLGILVEKYGLTHRHPAIQRAAEYLFSKQTAEGDFRGIYGSQYSPNYSGGIMELLIKAGMEADPRIEKAFRWLLSLRQEDGGWAIAMRTHGMSYREATELTEPLLAVSSKPFSHLITGVVLRAFAAHPQHRQSRAARDAGRLLASRFFQADKYVDRRSKAYWERVSYPFWFTDIVSALDSLSQLGFHSEDPAIENALDRLRDLQLQDGLFQLKLLRAKDNATKFWVCLAICRIFQRFFSPQ